MRTLLRTALAALFALHRPKVTIISCKVLECSFVSAHQEKTVQFLKAAAPKPQSLDCVSWETNPGSLQASQAKLVGRE